MNFPVPYACLTNILKPVYATLRKKGHLNVGYMEDSYLQGGTIHECQSNVTDTCCLFTRFGCTMKSVLGPVETLVLSGFCAELCQYNCVPLPKQCLGLFTVDLCQFH